MATPAVALPQEAPGADYAVERYVYEFPFAEFFGKSKHKVGDYAEVVHRVGGIGTRGRGDSWRARRDLWIEISTKGGATLRLDAKLVERGVIEDHATLLDELFEELLDMQIGQQTDVERSATGTLTTSDEPGAIWQFALLVLDPHDADPFVTAELVNDKRRLWFEEQDCIGGSPQPGRKVCVGAWEGNRWLGSGDAREYVFREGLDPGLKLVVLGGIEAAKIAVRFNDSIH